MQLNKSFLVNWLFKTAANLHPFVQCRTFVRPTSEMMKHTLMQTLFFRTSLGPNVNSASKLRKNWSHSSAYSKLKSRFRMLLAGSVAAGITGLMLSQELFGVSPVGRVEAKAPDTNDDNNGAPSSIRSRWNFIADIVEKAAPAVVRIERQGRHPFTGQQMAVSNGSGFIVRSDGLILTNAHVVGNCSSVVVRLHDGQTLDGTVQAVDTVSDLATVKISATNLPTLRLGNSSDLRTGEWVVAMGSPLQLSNTVTAGIVSSAERGSRELGLNNRDFNYIQTDANINHGNSGGPLINLDGDAIGINTLMVTSGISFAIPSSYAATFLQKAETIEKRSESKRWFGTSSPSSAVRRYAGIAMLTLTPDIVRSLKARQHNFPDVDHGVLVNAVVVGSPADSAGLQPGDVITKINNADVWSSSDVYKAISSEKELTVTVMRAFDTLILTVVPEDVIN